jgi:hypothetical protein
VARVPIAAKGGRCHLRSGHLRDRTRKRCKCFKAASDIFTIIFALVFFQLIGGEPSTRSTHGLCWAFTRWSSIFWETLSR